MAMVKVETDSDNMFQRNEHLEIQPSKSVAAEVECDRNDLTKDRPPEDECTKMAAAKVGNFSDEIFQDNKPCFFKIIWPGLTTEKLRIPPCFVKHIQEMVSDKAIMTGPFGGSWYVQVRRTTNNTYMKDGWKEFVRDNYLKKGDFLLITYEGSLYFSTQIFDPNGLERVSIPDSSRHQVAANSTEKKKQGKLQQHEEHIIKRSNAGEHQNVPSSFQKKRPGRPKKDLINHDASGSGTPEETTSSSSKRKLCILGKDMTKKCQIFNTIKKEDADSSTERKKPGRPSTKNVQSVLFHQSNSCAYSPVGNPERKQSAKGKDTERKMKKEVEKGVKEPDSQPTPPALFMGLDSILKEYGEENHFSKKSRTHKKQKNYHSPIMQPPTGEVDKTWRLSESFTSKFPHYKCSLQQFHVGRTFIMPISQKHFPLVKAQVLLCNSDGESWLVNVAAASDKHPFSEGWRSFVLDNKLSQGDICIFELVCKDEIQVHIFRDPRI